MKKIFFLLMILTGSYLAGCKKTSNGSFLDDSNLMTVKEYKTNIPLPGVQISLYKCTNYDDVFGCRSKSLFASHVTDAKGEYRFTNGELNQANEGVILKKSRYFDGHGGQGERTMEPEAWINIHLKPTASYPDTTIFTIYAAGELGAGSSQSFRAPKDSTIRLRAVGNESNVIKCLAFTKDPRCFQFCIIDTFAFGTFSVSPAKFEVINHPLDY